VLNPDIRVFFVTGYESEEIKRQVEDLQPCVVFAKPLDFDQFIAQMKQVSPPAADEESQPGQSAMFKSA
jgi:hypothetical protein